MIHEKDWLMRQILTAVEMMARIIFRKTQPRYEIMDVENMTAADQLHEKLLGLLGQMRLNDAENLLFEKLDTDDQAFLLVAIDFYARVNELEDGELAVYDFSREEIESGLQDVKELFGVVL